MTRWPNDPKFSAALIQYRALDGLEDIGILRANVGTCFLTELRTPGFRR